MISTIRKRNGQQVPYNSSKITNAISKAFEGCGEANPVLALTLTEKVEKFIQSKFHSNSIPAVEEIQDSVEHILIDQGYVTVAKAYILYREQHRRIRETKEVLLNIQHTMDGYLKQQDWRVDENSNVNYSLGGLILHNSGAITANYWLEEIYDRDISEAHRNGDFHLHDLSMFSGYCAGWSLRQLIAEGLGGVKNKISSRPAKHLTTLVQQMVNFLGVMQNEWAGAQAFSSFDTYLAPFVKVDHLSYSDVKQAIQSFVFGVNTPSRWGSQAPFTNITFDWVVPKDLCQEGAIVGGKLQDFTYGDCQAEMDIINHAFLEVLMEGDANGRGFAYPIPTYNLTREFDWNSKNAELLFRITGKYGTPNFQNFLNSDLDPSDVRSMCCRLQLDKRELRKRGGGLFGADEFTGSIGVVTLNLPRIGYLSSSKEQYFAMVDHMMDLASKSLEIKRQVITRLMKEGLFPYTERYLRHWNNHFSTIGLIGMNESMLNFLGKDLSSTEARDFAKEVLIHMRERLKIYQNTTGCLYNLEATPGEGTSYRLAKIDRKKFPAMKMSGQDHPFYTNSTQLPVHLTADIFEALDMQEELQTLYTGGTMFHGFIGEAIDEVQTVKKLVKTIASNYKIPYFTISPTFSVCENHGYLKGEQFKCSICGKDAEVYSRIVGYYRPVQNWNHGKKSEYAMRTTYRSDLPTVSEIVVSHGVEESCLEEA